MIAEQEKIVVTERFNQKLADLKIQGKGWCRLCMETKLLSEFDSDSECCRECVHIMATAVPDTEEEIMRHPRYTHVGIANYPPDNIEFRCSNMKNIMLFKNGMIDIGDYIRTGYLQLWQTDFWFTQDMRWTFGPDHPEGKHKVFPYDFNRHKRSQLYEDTINSIFNGDQEQIRTWHMWLGYNLLPDMSQEKLMFLIGGRRSGKGTMLDVLRAILGEDQCVSTTFRSVGSRFGLAGLEGKLAATIGDARMPTKAEANAALEIILQITGGDSVTIEPKFKQNRDARLNCRFTIAMNEIPTFADSALAFAARSIPLYFPNDYFGKEDVTLKRRLKKEANQGKLINYALDGLLDLKKQGYFIIPESSEPLLQQLEEITAPVTAFVRQCCTLEDNDEAYSTKEILFEAWIMWCRKNNHKIGSAPYFCRFLKQGCPSVKEFRPREGNGKRIQAFKGIVLQDWVYDEYLDRPCN